MTKHRGKNWNKRMPFDGKTTADDPLGWNDFVTTHTERVLLDGVLQAPVDWSDTPDASDWFFVIGYGRTGTSVLSAMLSEHPNAYCGCEDRTVFSLFGLLCTRWIRTLDTAAITYEWRGRKGWTGKQLRCFAEAYRAAMELQLGRNLKCIGDKSTKYLTHRDFFRQAFPDCTFFYTVRHPLDQLSSLINLVPGQTTVTWDGTATGAACLWAFVEKVCKDYLRMRQETDVEVLQFERFFDVRKLGQEMVRAWGKLGVEVTQAEAETLTGKYAAKPLAVDRWRKDEKITALLKHWAKLKPVMPERLAAVQTGVNEYQQAIAAAWKGEGNGRDCSGCHSC